MKELQDIISKNFKPLGLNETPDDDESFQFLLVEDCKDKLVGNPCHDIKALCNAVTERYNTSLQLDIIIKNNLMIKCLSDNIVLSHDESTLLIANGILMKANPNSEHHQKYDMVWYGRIMMVHDKDIENIVLPIFQDARENENLMENKDWYAIYKPMSEDEDKMNAINYYDYSKFIEAYNHNEILQGSGDKLCKTMIAHYHDRQSLIERCHELTGNIDFNGHAIHDLAAWFAYAGKESAGNECRIMLKNNMTMRAVTHWCKFVNDDVMIVQHPSGLIENANYACFGLNMINSNELAVVYNML